jgi:hypothetical protein
MCFIMPLRLRLRLRLRLGVCVLCSVMCLLSIVSCYALIVSCRLLRVSEQSTVEGICNPDWVVGRVGLVPSIVVI